MSEMSHREKKTGPNFALQQILENQLLNEMASNVNSNHRCRAILQD